MNIRNLAKLRTERRLTQVELATLSGLTQGHITDMERGRIKHPSLETYMALAKGFGADLHVFLNALEIGTFEQVATIAAASAA